MRGPLRVSDSLTCPCPPLPAPKNTTGTQMSADTVSSILNLLAVKAYGEAEFWLSGGKVVLIFML